MQEFDDWMKKVLSDPIVAALGKVFVVGVPAPPGIWGAALLGVSAVYRCPAAPGPGSFGPRVPGGTDYGLRLPSGPGPVA